MMGDIEKFVIAKDGGVARRFAPTVAPDDPRLVSAIEAELAK
jgi:glutathione peroxidase